LIDADQQAAYNRTSENWFVQPNNMRAPTPLELRPLSPAIGAEVHGVDLGRPLDDETKAALLDAWHKHILLLFRDQDIPEDALLHSADWIGTLGARARPEDRRQEADPYIMLVSNIRENGKAIGSLPDGEMWFHHDMAFVDVPHKATFLHAIEVPSTGGHTLFANMYGAYDRLPQILKVALEGKKVHQIFDFAQTGMPDLNNLEGIKHAIHPAIVQHPVTGKCALYINRLMSATIVGMDRQEARRLLDQIIPYAEDPDIVYEHHWRPGDFIVWDNRCSTHARTDFPAGERRLLRRGMIEGAPMIAAETPTPAR
jgi:taurine dioxygenase